MPPVYNVQRLREEPRPLLAPERFTPNFAMMDSPSAHIQCNLVMRSSSSLIGTEISQNVSNVSNQTQQITNDDIQSNSTISQAPDGHFQNSFDGSNEIES